MSAIAIVALGAWLSPATTDFFLYDRHLIAAGQAWRLWTGHLAHHSASHLLWNLAVFLPAGVWLERIAPLVARIFLGVGPLLVSAALWAFDPQLQFYAGLSGLTVGVLTLLALVQLQPGAGEPRWIWAIALVLVGAKIALEFARPEAALFAGLPNGVRNVPLAHLAGASAAALVAGLTWRKKTGP